MGMKLKFEKTHVDAVLPVKNHDNDTGMDVTSVESVTIPARGSAVVGVGLKFAYIEEGFWVKVEGRSGLGLSMALCHIQVSSTKVIVAMLVLNFIT